MLSNCQENKSHHKCSKASDAFICQDNSLHKIELKHIWMWFLNPKLCLFNDHMIQPWMFLWEQLQLVFCLCTLLNFLACFGIFHQLKLCVFVFLCGVLGSGWWHCMFVAELEASQRSDSQGAEEVEVQAWKEVLKKHTQSVLNKTDDRMIVDHNKTLQKKLGPSSLELKAFSNLMLSFMA